MQKAAMKIVAPQKYMRPGALRRAVLLADRGVLVKRVIPVPILVALDEAHLAKDAHLTYGVQFETGPSADREAEIQRGFVARACAYVAMMLSPSKQAYLYENVMSLEDIVRYGRGPVSQFEIDRAELFDHVQGGNRAELLGVKVAHDKVLEIEFEPLRDHA
jgi:hypothetical protein